MAGSTRLKLRPQAGRLLLLLLDRQGEFVSRADIEAILWPNGTPRNIDVGQQINTCVRLIRSALNDQAKRPTYIETCEGGYCFIAPVSACTEHGKESSPETGASSGKVSTVDETEDLSTCRPYPPVLKSAAAVEISPPIATSVGGRGESPRILWILIGIVVGLALGLTLLRPIQSWLATIRSRNIRANPILSVVDVPQSDVGRLPVRYISISGEPNYVLISSSPARLYVSEFAAGSVEVVDLSSEKLLGRIPVGPDPSLLAMSKNGQTLYIGLQKGGVRALDLGSYVLRTLGSYREALNDMVIAPDGKTAYLAMGYQGLRELDLRTGDIQIISRQVYVQALALSPDGRRLFVSYQAGGPGGTRGHDAIGVFSTDNGKLVKTVKGFANVGAFLSVSPNDQEVWENGADACDSPQYDHVSCPAVPAGLINVIDTASCSLKRSIAVRGTRALCVHFTPDGALALVSTVDRFLLVSTRSYKIVGWAPTSSQGRIAVAPDGQFAYVPVIGKNAIAVVPLAIPAKTLTLANMPTDGRRIPVAVLTTQELDPKMIDVDTIRLGGEPVARSPEGFPIASVEGVTGYDKLSLIVQFKPVWPAGTSSLPLTAMTLGGIPIRGNVFINP
ncbi:MAG: winged helix-turn-helix domain-containing protein [Bryobacteraceae bacterium]